MTGLPAVIGNDVQVGLYGEHQFGAARDYRHVLGIFMGTGIGGALILNGELYRGATGTAGEVGHLLLDPLGPVCGCGKRDRTNRVVQRREAYRMNLDKSAFLARSPIWPRT